MAKAGKGLLEGTLQAGTSAVSDKLLDLVGLGGKSAADKGKDTRDYLAAAFPELNAWERAGADFFFSSRRRHTRLVSDWSSDVCSSDLFPLPPVPNSFAGEMARQPISATSQPSPGPA